MSDLDRSAELDGELLQVIRDLGAFRVDDVAEATGRGKDEIERTLQASPGVVERVQSKPGVWRVRGAAAAAESLQAPADPKAAEQLADEATAAIQAVESGTVLDPDRRKVILGVAEQRMQLARVAAGDTEDPALLQRLVDAQGRVAKLRGGAVDLELLLPRLADWTADLPQPRRNGEASAFRYDDALQSAATEAADPNAVFAPALAALASGFARSPKRLEQADQLDREIRSAAIRGRVFDVLALSCLAAVTGMGALADAVAAALTTPAFSSTLDHTGRRVAYTALANLARPAASESYLAAAACAYLMRRGPPGRDEMELLAPAAIRSETIDPGAEFLMYARWLKWEAEHNPHEPTENVLLQFGHVARNFGYALDSSGYDALKRALPLLANHELSELLVRHLADERNNALDLRSVPPDKQHDDEYDIADDVPQFGARPREPVARLTDPARKRRYVHLHVPLDTKMAEILTLLSDLQLADVSQTFTNMRRQAASRL
jgi:hypothetical protein